MNDDPISQLPEPYHAAWNVLQKSVDFKEILKDTLGNAIGLASADHGMLVLKAENTPEHYFFIARMLPDMKPEHIYDGESLLDYLLARKAIQDGKSRLITDATSMSSQDMLDLLQEFESPRADVLEHDLANSLSSKAFLLVPLVADQEVVGTIILSRLGNLSPFSQNELSLIELFAFLIARYIHAMVLVDESAREKSKFMNMFAYEVHNPLTSIRGYSELLLDSEKFGTLTENQKMFLGTIQQNVKRIRRSLGNFNDSAKLEADQVRLENKKFDLAKVVLEQCKQIEKIVEAKKQTINFNPGENIFVQGDKIRVDYIVETIIRNAYSYSPEGSEIKISLETQNEFIRLSISDNGIGLTDEEKSRLFQKFYRSRRARFEVGTGLGLSISKHLIEKMGGQIGAEGSPNQGSTFWFTLPLSKEQ